MALIWIVLIAAVLVAAGLSWRRARAGVNGTLNPQIGLEQGTLTLTGSRRGRSTVTGTATRSSR
ncbi:hypothetical protein [Tsukamurella soli]|uniref:hypothetical protein n=1 Tax=Tsukamurella soli TaxID=644556 RepID=UPI00360A3F78